MAAIIIIIIMIIIIGQKSTNGWIQEVQLDSTLLALFLFSFQGKAATLDLSSFSSYCPVLAIWFPCLCLLEYYKFKYFPRMFYSLWWFTSPISCICQVSFFAAYFLIQYVNLDCKLIFKGIASYGVQYS